VIFGVRDEVRNSCRIFVRKPQIKRAFWRPNRGWEDNIKMNLRELDCVGAGFM